MIRLVKLLNVGVVEEVTIELEEMEVVTRRRDPTGILGSLPRSDTTATGEALDGQTEVGIRKMVIYQALVMMTTWNLRENEMHVTRGMIAVLMLALIVLKMSAVTVLRIAITNCLTVSMI